MKTCSVCKNHGKSTQGVYKDTIYLSSGQISVLSLCYSHSVDLFKMGQTNFVLKYRPYPIEYEKDIKVYNPLNNYFVFNSMRQG